MHRPAPSRRHRQRRAIAWACEILRLPPSSAASQRTSVGTVRAQYSRNAHGDRRDARLGIIWQTGCALDQRGAEPRDAVVVSQPAAQPSRGRSARAGTRSASDALGYVAVRRGEREEARHSVARRERDRHASHRRTSPAHLRGSGSSPRSSSISRRPHAAGQPPPASTKDGFTRRRHCVHGEQPLRAFDVDQRSCDRRAPRPS